MEKVIWIPLMAGWNWIMRGPKVRYKKKPEPKDYSATPRWSPQSLQILLKKTNLEAVIRKSTRALDTDRAADYLVYFFVSFYVISF